MFNLSFTICSWNLRGLGQQSKCDEVLAELISLRPSLVLLQETKLSEISFLKAKSFLPTNLQSYAFKPAVGSAGGILTANSVNLFALDTFVQHNFDLTTELSLLHNNQKFYVTNVYAPTDHNLKPEFLLELAQISPQNDSPWMVIGDFNLTRNASDKNNSSFRQDEADAFNDLINNLALIEFPLTDRLYTWSSNRSEPTLQRIDRVFINQAWNDMFPNSSVSSRTRFILDHVPLITAVSTHIPRPAIFCFENAWDFHPQCSPLIQNAWASTQKNSNAPKSLVDVLKRTRSKLRLWR
jgi:exonuclease III